MRIWLIVAFAVWAAAAVFVTLPSFLWQIEYYKNPGPTFYKAFLVVAPLVGLLAAGYSWARGSRLLRFELPALASFPLIAALAYEPWATMSCLLIVVSSYLAGGRALDVLGLERENPLEDAALSISAGFGLAVLILFPLGLLRLYHPTLFWAMGLAPFAFFYRDLKKIRLSAARLQRAWTSNESIRSPLVGVSFFFAFIFTGCSLGVILAPTVAYDAMNYHLALAEWYVGSGGLQTSFDHYYSFYPQAFELLCTWAYALGGIPATQLLSAGGFVLCLALCAHIGRQCGWRPGSVALGVAAAATMPFIHWTGSVVKNDLPMGLFQIACLTCLLGWRRQERFAWVLVGAFFLGMSFGVKHTAVFGAAPLLALGGYVALRRRRPVRSLASAAIVMAIVGGFWHLRTYLLTGSPTYPQETVRALDTFNETDPDTAVNDWRRFPRILRDAHLDGPRTFEAIIPAPVGIYLALFFPLSLMTLRREANWNRRAVAFFVFGALFYWMSLMSTLRYAIAPVMLLPLLVSPGVMRFYARIGAPLRAALVLLLSYTFVFAWSGIMIIENNGPQLRYLAGRLDKSGYLTKALGPYGVVEAVGKLAEPGDNILSIQCCAAVYAPESWRFYCKFLKRGEDRAVQIRQLLSERKYRFLVVPVWIEDRARPAGAQMEEVFRDSRYVAFQLF